LIDRNLSHTIAIRALPRGPNSEVRKGKSAGALKQINTGSCRPVRVAQAQS
jgi:hypothetical protein